MNKLTDIIPVGLYLAVGIVCLAMAFKNLFSSRFIPFHEKAAGRQWEQVDRSLQFVILALMRVAGLGFLIVSLLLIIFPVVNYYRPDPFARYAVPGVSFIYCTGLFLTNYYLRARTNARTPWKGSLYAMTIILTGIVISSL